MSQKTATNCLGGSFKSCFTPKKNSFGAWKPLADSGLESETKLDGSKEICKIYVPGTSCRVNYPGTMDVLNVKGLISSTPDRTLKRNNLKDLDKGCYL